MHIKHLLAIGAAMIGTAALPSFATEATLRGAFALPDTTEKVTAELVVGETGPLTRELLIAFTDRATGQPITHFDEELSQELHVLATDSDFSSFVHEHAGKLGSDGRFRVAMRFPKPGTYYVYADAVPTGLGQQVVRFEVPVDVATGSTASQQAPVSAAKGSDGPYTVKLDASALRVGTESMMALTILKDGEPAMDLGLYLGVPAHAVFVSIEDLGYVHAHAMAADAPKGSHTSHGSHDDPKAAIPSQLMLHAMPPRTGRYALWIQFKGGGQVRTVPFVVTVPAAL
ncbi:hypothetical protein EC912_101736 [Luteibacter rhizovicinus]|uniref:Secreted protein n=1 Tax=Luteibacter rhizovicinus TaxID=242606 RepID=A0A4V2W4Z2_9GAMM|nr:hypothetical protein [Luteibacter rhizovicinus]TCV97719.1 hypothetical protein EC912_101736 [Luteibacter rhizovicinus]